MYEDHVVLLFDTPMMRGLCAELGEFVCLDASNTLPGYGGVSDDILRNRNRVQVGARAYLRVGI